VPFLPPDMVVVSVSELLSFGERAPDSSESSTGSLLCSRRKTAAYGDMPSGAMANGLEVIRYAPSRMTGHIVCQVSNVSVPDQLS
jgi:hypothetical protein